MLFVLQRDIEMSAVELKRVLLCSGVCIPTFATWSVLRMGPLWGKVCLFYFPLLFATCKQLLITT